MAVSREELQEDLPWDVERIPVGIGEHASDDALELLHDLADDHESVKRVASYADRDGGQGRVATEHLLRALKHADGRLALVTWNSGGITAISYRPCEQQYEIGNYYGLAELTGDEPESHKFATRGFAKEELAGSEPTVVLRSESKLLDEREAEVVA